MQTVSLRGPGGGIFTLLFEGLRHPALHIRDLARKEKKMSRPQGMKLVELFVPSWRLDFELHQISCSFLKTCTITCVVIVGRGSAVARDLSKGWKPNFE